MWLSSTAVKTPVKFQNNENIQKPNLLISGVCKIYRRVVYCLVNRGPVWSPLMCIYASLGQEEWSPVWKRKCIWIKFVKGLFQLYWLGRKLYTFPMLGTFWLQHVVCGWDAMRQKKIDYLNANYYLLLTHWGRVRHICPSGLSPDWCQAIIWTHAGILLIGPQGQTSIKFW